MPALSFEEQCAIIRQGFQEDWNLETIGNATGLGIREILDIFDRIRHEGEDLE